MTLAHAIFTADNLWNLPDDGLRHELVKGELRTMPLPGAEHGAIAMNIGSVLAVYVRAKRLGAVFAAETGFRIATDPDTVRGADVAFVAAGRIPGSGIPAKYFPFAPDLAVEVVSPSDTHYYVDEKVQDWLDAGARLVWLVNPRRRTITVHAPGREARVLREGDQLLGEEVVEGFVYAVRDAFGE